MNDEVKTTIRILMIDDDDDDALLVRRLLNGAGGAHTHYRMDWVPTYDEGLAGILARAHDLYLLDYHLGERNGLELLHELQKHHCQAPVIILTGLGDEAVDQAALEAGALDYLSKNFLTASDLERVIRYSLQQARTLEQLRQAHDQLEGRVRERTADLARVNEALRVEIAERERAEAQVRQSREWLHVTLSSIGDAVIATDESGSITFINRVAAALTAWPAEEAIGRPLCQVFTIVHETTHEACGDLVARVLSERRIVTLAGRTALLTRDGREIPIENSAAPIMDHSGAIAGVVLVFHDVTQRRRAQEALQESEARLRAQAQALAEANTALQEADQRKNEFLAMLAHELRNPLAPVRNAVQVLRLTSAGNDSTRRQHEVIERQVKHMAHLLDDLLDVSRVTRGKIALEHHPLALIHTLNQVVETATPLIEMRRQRLSFTFPPENVMVEGDQDRLTQIFGNLLTNASKFSDEGKTIWLELRREGAQAVISVRDDGIGLEPQMVPRIFDLFTQVDQSLARSRGGLGIGLTMARRLVTLHGGTIEAHSPGLGQGCEFIVRLPLLGTAATPEAPLETDGSPEATEAEPAEELNQRRVLVVDDVVDSATSLAELIRLWGYHTQVAHDGPAALAAAQAFHPDIILLDIGLPGMDGYEVARQLRQRPDFSQTILIAMTGYGQSEDRTLTRQIGFTHHLIKPVDLDELTRILQQHAAASAHRSTA